MTTHSPPEPPRKPQPPRPVRQNEAETALAISRAAILRARYTSYWEVYKKPPPFV